jgi:hypothetical protein
MSTTNTAPAVENSRQLLRHAVATVAYRGGKALRGAPESFAEFELADKCRTPAHILAHIGDLYDWALALCHGRYDWHDSTPLLWQQEIERFFAALKKFDDYLAGESPLGFTVEKLFQGPVADSLTHIGQIAMMRRAAGCPIRGESYFLAEMAIGRVGDEQAAPVKEFA